MKALPINEFVDFCFRAGILVATYRDSKSPLTLENVMTILDDRLAFQQGVDYPVLIISPQMIRFEPKAIDYLSGEEGMKGISAAAILLPNWAMMQIARIFMTRSKLVPVEIFFKKKGAIKWLREQCELHGEAVEAFQFEDPIALPIVNKKMTIAPKKPKNVANKNAPTEQTISFTSKEKEIIDLIGEGLSSQEIASRLTVDKRTIDKHRQHINQKIGVKSVAGFFHWLLEYKKNTA